MQTIRLSTTPGVVNPGVYLSQYDVGRQMLFLLYDDVGKYIPEAGSTVHIRATKPSGFGFDVACIWSQNSVTVTVTDEMSNESGSFAAELRITKDDAVLGTANFLWNVERSPHPDGTIDGSEQARNLLSAIMSAIGDAEEAAAEARAAAGAGMSDDLKEAILQIASKVIYVDDGGQTYYQDLYDALYPPIPATAITLSKSTLSLREIGSEYTLVATVTPAGSTDSVSWTSSDTSVATVDTNGKVKAIAYGTATITATAGSVSATCSVTVAQITLSSIDATFTQGSATIYTNDSLDDLKPYLVVKAIYSDSSEEVLADTDYSLSGTLTAGTSTITATYEGKTDTFTVTVTQYVPHYAIVNNLTHVSSSNASITTVEENDSFATSLGVQQGYAMQSVTVTMGGVDITSTVYNPTTMQISISAVTGNVVITAVAAAVPASISAVFTQGGATILPTTPLDELKQYLVVTATYSDSSTAVIPGTDYTLSGTLSVGTSTITATYMTKTDSFTVTVSSSSILPAAYQQVEYIEATGTQFIDLGVAAALGVTYKMWVKWADTTNRQLHGGNSGYYFGVVNGKYQMSETGTTTIDVNASTSTYDEVEYYRPNGQTVNYTVNGVSGTVAKNVSSNPGRVGLFALLSNLGVGSFQCSCRLKDYVEITNNGISYKLYSCYRISDNVIGMYDTINDTFYTNAGTGTFGKGGDV